MGPTGVCTRTPDPTAARNEMPLLKMYEASCQRLPVSKKSTVSMGPVSGMRSSARGLIIKLPPRMATWVGLMAPLDLLI